mmetsp:Transcript_12559/g.30905  ORF Transcript_12559/g.30905 Transcript_12559/m.30905 type:complete len:266 (-) Transcript_12559:1715-2512(-)
MEQVREWLGTFDRQWERVLGPQHPLSKELPAVVPHYALVAGVGYLLVVALVPQIMQALNLRFSTKPVMRVYNLFMVVLSFYMGTYAIYLARKSNDALWCVPLASGEAGANMAWITWVFTYSKIIEFLDTVFMILEGRMRQVSFLHVYHHVSILAYWYAILWMAPGSDAYFSLAGNSYIHVMMYGYYFLASIGISPWWKYYITYAQILQFVSFACQSIYVGYIKTDKVCDFPNFLSRGLLWYMLTLIALFTHFLVVNKGKKKTKAA